MQTGPAVKQPKRMEKVEVVYGVRLGADRLLDLLDLDGFFGCCLPQQGNGDKNETSRYESHREGTKTERNKEDTRINE